MLHPSVLSVIPWVVVATMQRKSGALGVTVRSRLTVPVMRHDTLEIRRLHTLAGTRQRDHLCQRAPCRHEVVVVDLTAELRRHEVRRNHLIRPSDPLRYVLAAPPRQP